MTRKSKKSRSEDHLSTGKKVLFYLILLVILLVILAVLGELVLRIKQRDTALRFSPKMILELKPNYEKDMVSKETYDNLNGLSDELGVGYYKIYTNNKGFRMEKDIPAEKGDDEYRILVFGDSFTEAVEVPQEERFTEILEAKLNTLDSSTNFFVINGAIQVGSPTRYHLQFDEYVERSEPDMILMLHGANDLSDDFNNDMDYGIVEGGEGYPVSLQSRGKTQLFVKRYFWTPRYVYWTYWFLIKPKISKIFGDGEEYDDSNANGLDFWDLASSDEPKISAAEHAYINTTGKYTVQMKERAEAKDIEFIVVLQPYREFYHEEMYEPHYTEEYIDFAKNTEFDTKRHEQFMIDFLEENEVNVISVFPEFEKHHEEYPKRKLFNFYDYHFSVYGHQVMAESIFDGLKEDMEEI